jgi:transcriptional regulator with XRE-family HTH domain
LAALNVKLFYLRTREKRVSQQAVADALDVRQATVSHLERGQSAPNSALLLDLCRYYDVTPTWLLDDERDIPPLPTERWSLRNALLTVGMWIEAPAKAVVRLKGGGVLCPLLPDAAFFDDEAARIRRDGKSDRALRTALTNLAAQRAELQASLLAELEAEQARHPSQRDTAAPPAASERKT